MEISRRWKYDKDSRGRPSRRSNSYEDFIVSIILIAEKYDLDPKIFIMSFVEAWINETAHCGSLKITFREENQDSATFLISNGEEVVSQFPIKLEALKNPEHFKDQIKNFSISHHKPRRLNQKQMKIGELRYGMKGINIKAKIIEIPPAICVFTRFGFPAYVSNVTISDGTGSVRLSLWNNQINKVRVGNEVILKTCYIARFRGEPQLRLGRKGTLSIVDDEDALVSPKDK